MFIYLKYYGSFVGTFSKSISLPMTYSFSLTSFTVWFLFSLARFATGYNNFLFSSISGGNCSRTLCLFPANALGAAILTYSLSLYLSHRANIRRGYVWLRLNLPSLCTLSKWLSKLICSSVLRKFTRVDSQSSFCPLWRYGLFIPVKIRFCRMLRYCWSIILFIWMVFL